MGNGNGKAPDEAAFMFMGLGAQQRTQKAIVGGGLRQLTWMHGVAFSYNCQCLVHLPHQTRSWAWGMDLIPSADTLRLQDSLSLSWGVGNLHV